MGHGIQVIVHEPEDLRPRWRNSALDEYVEGGDPGGKSGCSSSTAFGVVYDEPRPRAPYGKREPVFGSLSAKGPLRSLFTPDALHMKTLAPFV